MATPLSWDTSRSIVQTLAGLRSGRFKICFKGDEVQLEGASYWGVWRAASSYIDTWERDLNKFHSHIIVRVCAAYQQKLPSIQAIMNAPTRAQCVDDLENGIQGLNTLNRVHYQNSNKLVQDCVKDLQKIKDSYEKSTNPAIPSPSLPASSSRPPASPDQSTLALIEGLRRKIEEGNKYLKEDQQKSQVPIAASAPVVSSSPKPPPEENPQVEILKAELSQKLAQANAMIQQIEGRLQNKPPEKKEPEQFFTTRKLWVIVSVVSTYALIMTGLYIRLIRRKAT